MDELKQTGTLQLDEDLSFQRREWRTSRVLWVVLLGVMLATGLGLFGNGPLSHARAGRPGEGLSVEYERFARFGATVRLTIHARPDADGTTRVRLSQSLLDAFQILAVTPPSTGTLTDAGGVEYHFSGQAGGTALVIDLQPIRRWRVESAVETRDGAVRFAQLIYP